VNSCAATVSGGPVLDLWPWNTINFISLFLHFLFLFVCFVNLPFSALIPLFQSTGSMTQHTHFALCMVLLAVNVGELWHGFLDLCGLVFVFVLKHTACPLLYM